MVASISDYATYLIDLDGVVYRGEELVPGAKQFIAWLEANRKKYLFPTNNSFASSAQVVAKLTRLGIATTEEHVLTASTAAVQYIAHHYPGGNVYVVGEQALVDILTSYKLHATTGSESQNISPRSAIPQNSIDAVLVGLDRTFDYKKLKEAIKAVRDGAAFIAINRDPLLPVEGEFLPGTGTMVAAIEAGSGVKPVVIGKPQPALLQEAMRLLQSQPTETLMIGDNLEVDIQAGKAAGTGTLLVLSGKESQARVEQSAIKPDYVYDDLAAVLHAMPPGH